MRTPVFWFNDPSRPGLLARMLSPFGAAYGLATAKRVAKPPTLNASVPVICIGNINAGGTGKTPTTIAIAQRLIEWGHQPHIVTRGYGGELTGPVQVDLTTHTPAQSGDEPLLLAAFAPTWVAKDRAAGVQAATNAGADVVLMDDGFQNPSVAKDISVVVVDAVKGFGNRRVVPAGPLREPVEAGLKRADALFVIGGEKQRAAFHIDLPPACPRLGGALVPLQTGMPWKGMRALAFAGIAHPEKFFATLRNCGVEVVRGEPLVDHQPLSDALLLRLEREAWALDAQLVTTEKDAVRIPAEFRSKVLTLPVRLEIENWGAFDALLRAQGLSPQ